jgi:RND family efflux transporter MFP subunit
MTETVYHPNLERKKGGVLRKILVVLIPILIIVGFVVATQVIIKMNAEPEEKKRSFNTLAVVADYAKQDDVRLVVNTQGEARPRTEIDLVPEVGGKIVYVSPNFLEGGIFRKGETLVRIDDADFNVAVIRAEANVATAQQNLVREVAEGEIARQDYEELGRSGTPSPLALREPQKAQARAALQAAQAELEAAKLNLSRTSVRAPFSGRVRAKASDVGQFVTPGARLGRIFSTDIVEVRLSLTDPDLYKLDLPLAYNAKSRATARPVRLSATIAGQKQVWDGRIMRTDSTYDTQSRALFAFAEVFDPYGKGASDNGVPLAPGLFVDAEIDGRTFEDVIVIPRDGLRPQDEVYVVDNVGKSEIRKVSVLDATSDRAVIRDGINVGELIILSPMERSRTEMTLKVLDVNNPETVLVDPPKPDWQKKLEEGEGDKDKKDAKDGDDASEKKRPLRKRDNPPPADDATDSEKSDTDDADRKDQ